MEKYDVIVVGGGMAGLTATSYLSSKYSTILIEKESTLGGLVGSFELDGFVFDKGARGIIDSGIVMPMLRQQGVEIDFLENPIKMIVEEESVDLKNKEDIIKYGDLLKRVYPDQISEIDQIVKEIQKVMTYMDVLYGIENPLFMPKPYSKEYLKETLLPWMIKFLPNIYKAMKMMEPINVYLKKISKSESLVDIITQHFFEETPTFFALSYFSLFLQYQYPKGSTQSLVDALIKVILNNHTKIHTSEEVLSIDIKNSVLSTNLNSYQFKKIVWAADVNLMYKLINQSDLESRNLRNLEKMLQKYKSLKGADSILSTFVQCEIDPSYFKELFGPHSFYTERKKGLSHIKLEDIKNGQDFINDKREIFKWLKDYLLYNTFEVSIPVLRDANLAPKGKTGLIISTLLDYGLTKHIEESGYYEEFKDFIADEIIQIFSKKIPQLKNKCLKVIVSTPLTIQKKTYAHEGSVSGYSFSNHPFPAEYQFLKVSQSVKTPFKNIKQAGQFAFNPAGVPVAILTGKLAADQIIKELK